MEVYYLDLEGNIFYEVVDHIIFGVGFLGDKCELVNSNGITVAEIDITALSEIKKLP